MLKQKLLNKLDEEKGLSDRVAHLAGYSSGSAFRKVLRDGNKEFAKFDGLLKVVQELFPEDEVNLMAEFSKTLDINKQTARTMLEYLSLANEDKYKRDLIEKMKKCRNDESKEIAHLYDVDDKISSGNIDNYRGIGEIDSLRVKNLNAVIFSKIAQMYCHYEMQNFIMVESMIPEIESMVSKMSNNFLKSTYYSRLYLAAIGIRMHNKSKIQLNDSLEFIANAPNSIKNMVYLYLGNSHMFHSCEKAIHFLKKGLENKTSKSTQEIRKSLNFISLLWNRTENYIDDKTESNRLFYFIKTHDKQSAEKMIKSIDVKKLDLKQQGFHYYYMGLLYESSKFFYMSLECFKKCSSVFYAQLPLIELKKQGVPDELLGALSA